MLQYSCQEYPIHRGASWAAVSKGSKIVGYDRETEHTCLLQKQTNKHKSTKQQLEKHTGKYFIWKSEEFTEAVEEIKHDLFIDKNFFIT